MNEIKLPLEKQNLIFFIYFITPVIPCTKTSSGRDPRFSRVPDRCTGVWCNRSVVSGGLVWGSEKFPTELGACAQPQRTCRQNVYVSFLLVLLVTVCIGWVTKRYSDFPTQTLLLGNVLISCKTNFYEIYSDRRLFNKILRYKSLSQVEKC